MYYRVPDIMVAAATLTERGVHFEQPPHPLHKTATHTLWMAAFRDPDGNYLHLMSEVALT